MRRSPADLQRGADASDDGKDRRQPSRFGSLAQGVLLAVSLLGVGVLLQAIRFARKELMATVKMELARTGHSAEAGNSGDGQAAQMQGILDVVQGM